MIDESHGEVVVHSGAWVEPTAVLIGPCEIKAGAYIGHYCVIGSPAQHHGYYPAPIADSKREHKGVLIQHNAIIREHCQVQQGIQRSTEVGFDSMVMALSHISHDTLIGPDVTVGTNSIFGGFTTVMYGTTLGQKVVTHPWIVIGQHTMIGQSSCVIRDVAPFQKVVGNPARIIGANTGASGEKKEWVEEEVDKDELNTYLGVLDIRDNDRRKK
jgi:UDP-N-acetylglucosamine acyltransferase